MLRPRRGRPLCWVPLAAALLLQASVHGSALRRAGRSTGQSRSDSGGASRELAEKVERILGDILQSVEKAGQDAEVEFATLFTYDQRLEAGLRDEIGSMNRTMAKLKEMREAFLGAVPAAAGGQGAAARGSQAAASAAVLLQVASQRAAAAAAASASVSTETKAAARQGAQAEKEQQAEELSFGVAFAHAVASLDRSFLQRVLASREQKAKRVEAIRKSRQVQLQTLQDLVDLLGGQFDGEPASEGAMQQDAQEEEAPPGPAEPPSGPDFLQVRARAARGRLPRLSGLQLEAENAIQRHADTHGILMRVKAMLASTAPIDVGSVQRVSTELSAVLRAVNGEQSRADDVKRRCEVQRLHASRDEQGLKASLELMSSVRNRTLVAIQAATDNLKGMAVKDRALQKSARDFIRAAALGVRRLERQGGDRSTIMAAVQKARDLLGGSASKTSTTTALLGQLLEQLGTQDQQERKYRDEESSLSGAFLGYVRDYQQLLRERRGHYEGSISALKLYANEVAGDTAAQSAALETSGAVSQEGRDLCAAVMRFYQHHRRWHRELGDALRVVLPKVPAMISAGMDADEAEDGSGE